MARDWSATNLADGTKKCARCGEVKPFSEYRRNPRRPAGGWLAYCRPCESAYQRERRAVEAPDRRARRAELNKRWMAEHREERRAMEKRRRIERKGITVDDFQRLWEQQDGKCAICDYAPPDGETLSIDHAHDTAIVRALLCARCNAGLGQFMDSPALLDAAAAYLRRHGRG